MKRTHSHSHSHSPTIKNEVVQEPLAKRVKQEGAGAAAALTPALVAVKQEMGAHSGQPAVHPSGVLPAHVPVGNAELRQLVQSQGKQLQSQSQQLQSQSNQIELQKSKIKELEKEITGLKESRIEIKQFPEGTYRGQIVNGLATGHGNMTYKKVDKFQRVFCGGVFKDGKLNGQGIMQWADGRSYEGQWKDDKYNGQGTLKWTDGKSYEGEFKDGKKHGQGTFKWAN